MGNQLQEKRSTKERTAKTGKPGVSVNRRHGHPYLRLQRKYGNRSVATSLRNSVQTELKIGNPGDEYEREAERVANEVMRMAEPSSIARPRPTTSIQRKCKQCDEEDARHTFGNRDQRQTSGVDPASLGDVAGQAEDLPIGDLASGRNRVSRAPARDSEGDTITRSKGGDEAFVADETARSVEALTNGGRPLPSSERQFMEPRFGRSFDAVRIHTGPRAAGLARDLRAKAFTIGSNIVFGAGRFRPGTTASRSLLAHELTHVIQQAPDTARRIQRQPDGEASMSREEEIRLSRTSPGRATFQASPRALSLFNFGIDRHQPKAFHRDVLRELALLVRGEVTVAIRTRVAGHTSAPGSSEHNLALAGRRAQAVANILRGEGLTNVVPASHGESAPVASNDTVEGRSRNRRVDVMLSAAPGPGPVPRPRPPTTRPPTPTRPPRPETPEPDFCDRYPILCHIIPPIPIPIPIPFPIPWPLLCALAPELCALLPCVLNPSLCIPGPPGPPGPPRPPQRPQRLPFVFIGRVRASNTPSAMGDRIPDSGATFVPVLVSGWEPPMAPIQIRTVGAGPANGNVLIDGAGTTTVTGSSLLAVSGTSQTSPAAGAFNLRLEALLGSTPLAQSPPFAVSAIMFDMSTSFSTLDDLPAGVDFGALMSKQTDGADGLRSLTEMEYGEELALISETGGMVGLGLGSHGFLALAEIDQIDWHGTPRSRLAAEGEQQLMQVHTFVDHRTGSTDIPVTNSGFNITRRVEPDPSRPGCLMFVIEKFGQAGRAGGFRSSAGSGRAQGIVRLPCHGPGGGGHTPGGGGPGPSPATPSLPTPFFGPLPPGAIPFSFVSMVPSRAQRGMAVALTIAFRTDGVLFTSTIPCVVTDVTLTHVVVITPPVALSLAPPGFTRTVMPALKSISIPRSLL